MHRSHTPNKIFALSCAKKKKKESSFFRYSLHVLSPVCNNYYLPCANGERDQRERHSNRNYLFAALLCSASITGRSPAQSEIYRVPLSFETPAQAPGNNEPRCTFWSLRDPIASLPCYPAVLSKQYAPLAACLRINREHAPLFHPRETSLPLPPLVQSSRSKAFKVISVNSREKKLAHCRWWFSTMHRTRIEDGVYRPGSRSRNRLQSVTNRWITCAVSVRY